jgi:hypothetical protein
MSSEHKRWVFIVDGEVGPDIHFESGDNIQRQALAAALSSDPKVVEVPMDSDINIGWTWDGENFYPPQ